MVVVWLVRNDEQGYGAALLLCILMFSPAFSIL